MAQDLRERRPADPIRQALRLDEVENRTKLCARFLVQLFDAEQDRAIRARQFDGGIDPLQVKVTILPDDPEFAELQELLRRKVRRDRLAVRDEAGAMLERLMQDIDAKHPNATTENRT